MPWWQFIIVHHISIHMSLIFSVSAPLCRHFRQNVSHQEHPRIYVFFLRMNTPQELSTRICMVKVFLGPTFWHTYGPYVGPPPPHLKKTPSFASRMRSKLRARSCNFCWSIANICSSSCFKCFKLFGGWWDDVPETTGAILLFFATYYDFLKTCL